MWRNEEVRRQWGTHLIITGVLTAAGCWLDWRCGCLLLLAGFGYGIAHLLPLRRRYADIAALCEDIDRVLHGQEHRAIGGSAEGELAILQSEIQKMVIRLRDAADSQRRERGRLADAMADISHQLRTPLTSMNLTASLLASEELTQERRLQLTRELKTLLVRVDWLVEALLKMSKIDAGAVTFEHESASAAELIDRAAAPLAVPMDVREQTLQVSCDRQQFAGDLAWSVEALGNVLKNCMEHTPRGGVIRVEVRETALFTQITVRDSGSGFDTEDIPHIFERFYKGKNAGEGSFGIGLALARMIQTGQNGTIWAENAPEGGALFTLRWYKSVV